MSAAELPRLAPGSTVCAKELADLLGVDEDTVTRRMRLSITAPADPRAIPYLHRLGRPYRTTRAVLERLLTLSDGGRAV